MARRRRCRSFRDVRDAASRRDNRTCFRAR